MNHNLMDSIRESVTRESVSEKDFSLSNEGRIYTLNFDQHHEIYVYAKHGGEADKLAKLFIKAYKKVYNKNLKIISISLLNLNNKSPFQIKTAEDSAKDLTQGLLNKS